VTSEQERQRRLDDIADLAEGVSDEYTKASQRTEPEAIIAAKKITLSFGDYADAFDGLLEHKNGAFHIYGNLHRLKSRESGRARFTLAHELGHFFIDDHRRELQSGRTPSHPSFSDYQSKNPVEQEADHFASHLLMPLVRFAKAGKRVAIGLEGVLALRDTFGTSITSTAIRCTKLEVGPYTLIKWSPDDFEWKWFSPSTFAAGYRAVMKTKANIPRDSATGKAMAGDTLPEKGFFQSGTSASAWFPGIWAGTQRDVLFIEQAILLGEFGVLTLLFPEQRKF